MSAVLDELSEEGVTQWIECVRERDPLCRTRTQCCCALNDTVHPVCGTRSPHSDFVLNAEIFGIF